MGAISFGPGLAGFPAFPELSQLSPAELAGLLLSGLDLQVTATTLSFTLDSAVFGRPPGEFDYTFSFTGDFASLVAAAPADELALLTAALTPATAANYLVQFQASRTLDDTTGQLVIAATADQPGPALPFAAFFGVLLDPANYTQDLLRAFTQNLSQFGTLDLTAFTGGVIDVRPNGPTIARDGTISRPGGGFEPSTFGVVSFAGEVSSVPFTTVLGGAGNDIQGTGAGNVALYAGNGNDLLLGGAGTDLLDAGSGHDILVAGSGANMLSGGAGPDYLVAGSGTDVLSGGAGPDTLVAGSGDDTLTGGAGANRFVIQSAPGAVTTITDFHPGQGDRLVLSGLLSPSHIAGDGHGDLVLTLGYGAAVQTVVLDGFTDQALLWPALQTEVAGDSQGGTLLAPIDGGVLFAAAPHETLIGQGGVDVLIAGAGGARLIAGSGNDVLIGGSGSDILLGGPGRDILNAGSGNDVLDGGTGNAVLVAGPGADILTGGTGHDTFVFDQFSGRYGRITDFQPGRDKIDISALLRGDTVTPTDFASFVKVVPLAPTELTGFLEVSPTGAAGGFHVVAQIDGAAFQIGANGQSASQLGYGDFILKG